MGNAVCIFRKIFPGDLVFLTVTTSWCLLDRLWHVVLCEYVWIFTQ